MLSSEVRKKKERSSAKTQIFFYILEKCVLLAIDCCCLVNLCTHWISLKIFWRIVPFRYCLKISIIVKLRLPNIIFGVTFMVYHYRKRSSIFRRKFSIKTSIEPHWRNLQQISIQNRNQKRHYYRRRGQNAPFQVDCYRTSTNKLFSWSNPTKTYFVVDNYCQDSVILKFIEANLSISSKIAFVENAKAEIQLRYYQNILPFPFWFQPKILRRLTEKELVALMKKTETIMYVGKVNTREDLRRVVIEICDIKTLNLPTFLTVWCCLKVSSRHCASNTNGIRPSFNPFPLVSIPILKVTLRQNKITLKTSQRSVSKLLLCTTQLHILVWNCMTPLVINHLLEMWLNI